jgi:hypothetical protein
MPRAELFLIRVLSPCPLVRSNDLATYSRCCRYSIVVLGSAHAVGCCRRNRYLGYLFIRNSRSGSASSSGTDVVSSSLKAGGQRRTGSPDCRRISLTDFNRIFKRLSDSLELSLYTSDTLNPSICLALGLWQIISL